MPHVAEVVINQLVASVLESIHASLVAAGVPVAIATQVAYTSSQATGAAVARSLRDQGFIVSRSVQEGPYA